MNARVYIDQGRVKACAPNVMPGVGEGAKAATTPEALMDELANALRKACCRLYVHQGATTKAIVVECEEALRHYDATVGGNNQD